jgi:hypothetical protein
MLQYIEKVERYKWITKGICDTVPGVAADFGDGRMNADRGHGG